MKKNGLLSDEIWAFQPFEPGEGAAPAGLHDVTYRDDGDPYPLADAAATGVTSLDVYASKPVASIATLADYLVNGFWHYNSTIAHHWASNTITYNITGLNSAEQFLALTAMQAWSEVANITFVQTSGAANITFTHNGTMTAYASGSWYGSGAIVSMTVNISTDWVTTDGGANDGKTGIDSYAYQTYIHEIGHALGLGHQGPYNGSASYSTNATYANDTWQYSIMSYFSEPNYSGSSYRYVVTPQMADIYAVGSIYGAATSTRTGDTVYGFNSNAGAVFNFGNYTSAPALTIYDSGGTDTLDCSGYSGAQTIDLRAGAFSSIGGLVNNVGIALNAVIEKAIGGSGNDTLIASNLSCTLSGGGGNDTIIGGAGSDTAIYSGNKSNYTISYNASTQTLTLVDKRTGSPDGTDAVSSVDYFQFADGTIASSSLVGPPNLSTQVFLGSPSATVGDAVSISTFVVNYGQGPTAASTSRIYLSTDANIATSDLLLATLNTGSLAAVGQFGYYDNQKLSVTLPANLASGTYYVGAIADYNNQIAESDETDNTYNVAQITVGAAPQPNLSAQVFPNASSATAGAAVSVSTFVVNYGAGSAAGSTSKIYLSTDPNITTSDIVLGTISTGSLAAVGQSGYYNAQDLSVTLPANLASGAYYIGAIADYNNQITETNETDNTYNVAQIIVTGAASPPNLSAQVFLSKSSAPAASAISVNTFVVNYGAGSAAGSTSKIYLSTDPNITTSDIVLATISTGSLAAVGQSGYYNAQNLSVTLPGNLASGTYYIGAIADYNNQIVESNETDNTYNVAQITVTGGAPPPNLSAHVFPASSSAAAGSSLSVNTFVANYGAGPAASSTAILYLSTDPNITTSDAVLATISAGSLAAVGQSGYYSVKSLSVMLPANLAPGTYYIGAIADYGNQIAESNETDNTYNVAQITITGTSASSPFADIIPSNASMADSTSVAASSLLGIGDSWPPASSILQVDLSTHAAVATSDLRRSNWATSGSADSASPRDHEERPFIPPSDMQQTVGTDQSGGHVVGVHETKDWSILAHATALSTEQSSYEVKSVFSDSVAAHTAFVFAAESSHDALPKSWTDLEAFAHGTVSFDADLTEHFLSSVETSDNSPIHKAVWEIAHYHLGDYIIR